MANSGWVSLGSFRLTQVHDSIDPVLMKAFRPSDLSHDLLDQGDPEELLQYVAEDQLPFYSKESPLPRVRYCCPSGHARDRLDLFGLTRKAAIQLFDKSVQDRLSRNQSPPWSGSQDITRDQLVLQSITADRWLHAFKAIRDDRLTLELVEEWPPEDPDRELLLYMLRPHRDAFGYPSYEASPMIRLILEVTNADELLVYDLSGYADTHEAAEADEIVEIAEQLTEDDFRTLRRRIVLTEGKTDSALLSRSLRLLDPHLTDYFHFFDYQSKHPGGVGALANLIRSFVAAEIQHRIVAVFDNDTAARDALRTLQALPLPENITICQYPPISLGSLYPTLGPTGPADMDVNGLAGGLELYLGEDSLTDKCGGLRPVQWTGYSSKLRAYQGEVSDKHEVIAAFEERLTTCERDQSRTRCYDWDGIRAILNVIQSAFRELDENKVVTDWLCI